MEQNAKYIKMTTEPVERLIASLAVPTIISMLVTSFYNLADTLFVRQLENDSMVAAVGVIMPLMSIIQSFGFFCVLDNTCEGLVPVGSLEGFFTYSEEKNTLSSKKTVFSAGDTVRIKVKYADTVRRKVEFEFVELLNSVRASFA